jgi:hypothetical protein
MPTQLSAHCSAVTAGAGYFRRFVLASLLSSAAALVSGCAAPPPPLAGPDPSNPAVAVAGVGYRSTLSGYRSQRPVEPAPWLEQNRGVAPNPEQSR